MPDRHQNGGVDSMHARLLDVENHQRQLDNRQRQLEISQAEYARDVTHVYNTLDELKVMMKTSVELQERQVTQKESLGRAFGAIRNLEQRDSDLAARDTDIEQKVDGYINRVRGAMWLTYIGWTVLIGVSGILFWLHG